ncbi:NACHT domain-containing protein [Colletotrichum cuscutae]|uniref:NACHT domain-containing protein n=1 Tax=Colletotrichum cuscutae TaxID=1209917 RepID=A0AAI9V497_9PEZI|nr:NACHT domain-containing protein [Colletotrichum cuscutae]
MDLRSLQKHCSKTEEQIQTAPLCLQKKQRPSSILSSHSTEIPIDHRTNTVQRKKQRSNLHYPDISDTLDNILAKDPDVNRPNDPTLAGVNRATPLHLAVSVNPNKVTPNGVSPLIVASLLGNIATIKTLIHGGALRFQAIASAGPLSEGGKALFRMSKRYPRFYDAESSTRNTTIDKIEAGNTALSLAIARLDHLRQIVKDTINKDAQNKDNFETIVLELLSRKHSAQTILVATHLEGTLLDKGQLAIFVITQIESNKPRFLHQFFATAISGLIAARDTNLAIPYRPILIQTLRLTKHRGLFPSEQIHHHGRFVKPDLLYQSNLCSIFGLILPCRGYPIIPLGSIRFSGGLIIGYETPLKHSTKKKGGPGSEHEEVGKG